MRNSCGGQCYRCGLLVAPLAGHFERGSNARLRELGMPLTKQNRWLVQHRDCANIWRGTTHTLTDKGPDNGNP